MDERGANGSSVAGAVVVDEGVELVLGVDKLLGVLARLIDGEVGHVLHRGDSLGRVVDVTAPLEGILLRVPLVAVDGVFLALNGGNEGRTVNVVVRGQDVVEVTEVIVAVPSVEADSPVVVVHGDGLRGERLHDPLGRVFEDAALGSQAGKVQRQTDILSDLTLKNVKIGRGDHGEELEAHAVTENGEMDSTIIGLQSKLVEVLTSIEQWRAHKLRTTTREDDTVDLAEDLAQLLLSRIVAVIEKQEAEYGSAFEKRKV